MEETSLARVVVASVVEVVSGVQLRRGKPCFLGLPLPRLEPDVRLTITDLYNIYEIENIRHMLTK